MSYLKTKCFVCQKEITSENSMMNKDVYLPVCDKCQGTEEEKRTVEELFDSLADGLVCGCI